MARIGKHEKGNLKVWCVFWGREERVLAACRRCGSKPFPQGIKLLIQEGVHFLRQVCNAEERKPFLRRMCSYMLISRLKESKPALPLFLEAVPMVTVSFATGRIQEQKSNTQSAIFQWANKNPSLRMLFWQVFITLFLTSLNIIGREGTWAMEPCLLSVIPLHMWLTLGSWLTIFG